MLRAYRVALIFMTTLPVPPLAQWRENDMRRSVGAYPLVGLTLGGVLAFAAFLTQSFNPLVQAALLVALWLGVTGALHFDGLCDTADAAFSSKSVAERQRIAKEPTTGAFALAGGIMLLVTKVTALATLYGFQWLLLAPLLARTLVVLPLAFMPVGAHSSLGQSARPERGVALTALVLGVLLGAGIAFAALPDYFTLLLLTGVFVWLLAEWIARRMGGLSGDSYGFLIETSETFVLVLLGVLV